MDNQAVSASLLHSGNHKPHSGSSWNTGVCKRTQYAVGDIVIGMQLTAVHMLQLATAISITDTAGRKAHAPLMRSWVALEVLAWMPCDAMLATSISNVVQKPSKRAWASVGLDRAWTMELVVDNKLGCECTKHILSNTCGA